MRLESLQVQPHIASVNCSGLLIWQTPLTLWCHHDNSDNSNDCNNNNNNFTGVPADARYLLGVTLCCRLVDGIKHCTSIEVVTTCLHAPDIILPVCLPRRSTSLMRVRAFLAAPCTQKLAFQPSTQKAMILAGMLAVRP